LTNAQKQERTRAEKTNPGQPLADAHNELHDALGEARREGLKGLPDVPAVPDVPRYLIEGERLALRAAVEKVLALRGRGEVERNLRALAADTRKALDAYEKTYAELAGTLADQRRAVFRAEQFVQQHEAAGVRWAAIAFGVDPATLKHLTNDTNLVGVPTGPPLPRHNCPEGYVPHVLEGDGDKAWAHWMGLTGEAHMANRIAKDMPGGHIVVDYGDRVGTNGYDAFSVDSNGMPHFWDSKYRSTKVAPFESDTFTESLRIQNAVRQAVIALNTKPGKLTSEQVKIARNHLAKGEFVAYTVHTRDAQNFHAAVRAEYKTFTHVSDAEEVSVPWNHPTPKP
jgi:hypothetical protein